MITYQEMNRRHRTAMDSIINPYAAFDWEEEGLLETIFGELPSIRSTRYDNDLRTELEELSSLFDSYNSFDTACFLKQFNVIYNQIIEKENHWNGVNKYEIERIVRYHDGCIIHGPGGIGKSYFTHELEREFENRKIPHVCLYGKFISKDTDLDLDIDGIIKDNKNGFVFVVDAINEISTELHVHLLEIVNKLENCPFIRIILTYRDRSIDESLLDVYRSLINVELLFPGVSYESALEQLTVAGLEDVFRYENILYSHNALLLNMLYKIIDADDFKEKESLISITHIYEHYIKESAKAIIKTIDCKSTHLSVWEETKKLYLWLYDNNETSLPEDIIGNYVKDKDEYLTIMSQAGLIGNFTRGDKNYYFFVDQSLSDYLFARALFRELTNKSTDEQIRIINKQIKLFPNLNEAIVLLLFDKYEDDIETINRIIESSELYLDEDTFLKVKTDPSNYKKIQSIFSPKDKKRLLIIYGGFSNQPFNCTNYLNQYYYNPYQQIQELSLVLSGHYFLQSYISRLKSILYRISHFETDECFIEEVFWFAMWSAASSNKSVRRLAMKILYEVIHNSNKYVEYLIQTYPDIKDYFIRESIIEVLCSFDGYSSIEAFLKPLIAADTTLTANSIERTYNYLGNSYAYIDCNCHNYYDSDLTYDISDKMYRLLIDVDNIDKYRIPIRCFDRSQISSYVKFIDCDKSIIKRTNSELREKYPSLNPTCHGCGYLMSKIKDEVDIFRFEELNNIALVNSFEKVFDEIKELYDPKTEPFYSEIEKLNSVLYKVVDISVGLYWGSLMCNYYTSDFGLYNSKQSDIGFEVYVPIEIDYSFHINSLVHNYSPLIEGLNNCLFRRIAKPSEIDDAWHNNLQLTKHNLQEILKPILFEGDEWCFLGGIIRIGEYKGYSTKWRDEYLLWSCSNYDESLDNDYEHVRFLTIELPEYRNDLSKYGTNGFNWYCCSIPSIDSTNRYLEETNLFLPPSSIIQALHLQFNRKNCTWDAYDGETVIVCNNYYYSYYKSSISSTIFIKKEYYDTYVKKNNVVYFGFCERLIEGEGFSPDTQVHVEIRDNVIKTIRNDSLEYQPLKREFCETCPYGVYRSNPDTTKLDSYLGEIL